MKDLGLCEEVVGELRDPVPSEAILLTDRSALFACFAGTIDEHDFFVPCIIGYGLRPSRCGPGHDYRGQNEDLPVPAQEVCVHAGGLMTTRGG